MLLWSMEEFLDVIGRHDRPMDKDIFDIVTGTYRSIHLYTPNDLCHALVTRSYLPIWTHWVQIHHGNSDISLGLVDDVLAIHKHVVTPTLGTIYEIFFFLFSLPTKIPPLLHKHFPRLLCLQGIDLVFEHIPITFHDMFRATPSVSARMDRFQQLITVLHELHTHGIYHRDLKPDNIRFHIDGTLVLLDFDSCIHSCRLDQRHTETPIGTVHYMAPEIMDRNPTYDAGRADIYSAGMLLISMVNEGQPLVHGRLGYDRCSAVVPTIVATALGTLLPLCRRMIAYSAMLRPDTKEILSLLQCLLPTKKEVPLSQKS